MIALWWTFGIAFGLVILVVGGLVLFAARTARRVEQALPPLGRFIDIDGARIHYLDEGDGPTLLLIHGLAGQMRNFTYALLDKLKRNYRVVILDRPGNGYSGRARGSAAAIGAQAETILRFAKALKLERPLLVGHSLGGAVALALASRDPHNVAGVALLAPVTRRPERVPAPFAGLQIRSPLVRRMVAWTLATPLSIKNRELVLTALFGPQPVPADFAKRGGGLLNLRPSAFIGASTDLVAAHEDRADITAHYGELKVPVGVIYGTADRILDPAAHIAALTENLPGVEVEMIEGGGHMILIDSADRCAAFVARMAQRAFSADATLAPVA